MLAMTGHVERLWQEYAQAIFKGVAVSDIQREETRMAFLAGMLAGFDLIAKTLQDQNWPETQAGQFLTNFDEELQAAIRAQIAKRQKKEPVTPLRPRKHY